MPAPPARASAAYLRQNGFAVALREVGRIERALFTLDWLRDFDPRRRANAGLNKDEARVSGTPPSSVTGSYSPFPDLGWQRSRKSVSALVVGCGQRTWVGASGAGSCAAWPPSEWPSTCVWPRLGTSSSPRASSARSRGAQGASDGPLRPASGCGGRPWRSGRERRAHRRPKGAVAHRARDRQRWRAGALYVVVERHGAERGLRLFFPVRSRRCPPARGAAVRRDCPPRARPRARAGRRAAPARTRGGRWPPRHRGSWLLKAGGGEGSEAAICVGGTTFLCPGASRTAEIRP